MLETEDECVPYLTDAMVISRFPTGSFEIIHGIGTVHPRLLTDGLDGIASVYSCAVTVCSVHITYVPSRPRV